MSRRGFFYSLGHTYQGFAFFWGRQAPGKEDVAKGKYTPKLHNRLETGKKNRPSSDAVLLLSGADYCALFFCQAIFQRARVVPGKGNYW